MAGGHPRRLGILLISLRTLTSILRPLRDSREKQLPDTVDDVRAILDSEQERASLLAALDPSSKTPNWYSNLVCEMDGLVKMTGFYGERRQFDETVQKRLVEPFGFPENDYQKEALRSTLFMIQEGKCSFLPQPNSSEGLLCVPYPILIQLELPFGDFLPSLTRYITSTDSSGRTFEVVMNNVLNTFAMLSPQDGFQLGAICRTSDSGSHGIFEMKLKPLPKGSEVDYHTFEHIPYPPNGSRNAPCPSLRHLTDADAGMYSLPESNPHIDAIGLFDLVRQQSGKHRLVVFFQWKDWYRDDGMLETWRRDQEFARKDHLATVEYLNDLSTVLHLPLFLANPLECFEALDPNAAPESIKEREGVMDLSHMQRWFPTAGYNVQAAHKLRRVYKSTLMTAESDDWHLPDFQAKWRRNKRQVCYPHS